MKTVFFDLFFTLANLEYQQENEFTLLNITRQQWEASAENPDVYNLRATGGVTTENEMLQSMVTSLPFKVDDSQLENLIEIRNQRMKKALTEIHPDILFSLKQLKENDVKLCLISNADIIDKKYWNISPLAQLFDDVIFSCDMGIVKPDKEIYQLAIERMNTTPDKCFFVGDGGSNELAGAKSCGISTIFTEFLTVKDNTTRDKILKSADFTVQDFKEIINIITN